MARKPSGKEDTIVVSVRLDPIILKEIDELVAATEGTRMKFLRRWVLDGLAREKQRPGVQVMIREHRRADSPLKKMAK
ncbi:MAG: hypothetical protein IT572_09440 [Deltaproteobacteria bacterium]|nr:hypothetical protein [Deltaproteobacteria bacterium]